MKPFDTHAHLDYLMGQEDWPQILERTLDACDFVLIPAVEPPYFERVFQAAALSDRFFVAMGLHPCDVQTPPSVEEILGWASHPKVVALGETGLDYYHDLTHIEAQKASFRNHIRACLEADLPVIVHSRDADEDTYAILKEEGQGRLRGVMHCFSSDRAQAQRVVELGLLVCFSGNVTYKKALDIQEAATWVPDTHLLVETDAPYLSPQRWRGKRNEPAQMIATLEKLAELRGDSLEDVVRITRENGRRLFRIDQESPEGEIAYTIRNSLYLNVTNHCTLQCAFCPKFDDFMVKGHYLKLAKVQPSPGQLIEAIGDPTRFDEIVFCGYGEPTLRLPVVLSVAHWIKEHGGKTRLNTDGLSNLVHKRNTIPELAQAIDRISISLNAQDEATYNRHCRPGLQGSYEAMKRFIAEAAAHGGFQEVIASAIDGLEGVDAEACRVLAESLGAHFRARPMDRVGDQ
ncbi:MAG: hypothetical protein AUJ55_07935 [Proteobacteria bacterium CG1_02_64_396]|nr:MAG: hypothetical protein AUJ55_07935 [Proteobacteria bacterium CG1_02_64_396]